MNFSRFLRQEFFWPGFLLLLIQTCSTSCGQPAASRSKKSAGLILATTTSLYDSGLLEELLPVFEKKTGLRVKPLAVGTGEALEMGKRGDADLLLVHAPEMEKDFMARHDGLRREELMASDFVLVGPPEDPAFIKSLPFPQALARIAQSGYPFLSRGDRSGTHFLEMKIWQEAGLSPSGPWYLETGQGMAETLSIASDKKGYTLADYPTYYKLKSRLKLAVLSRDPGYQNIYSAIIPRRVKDRGNEAGANMLLEFFLSSEARRIIAAFGSSRGDPGSLFYLVK